MQNPQVLQDVNLFLLFGLWSLPTHHDTIFFTTWCIEAVPGGKDVRLLAETTTTMNEHPSYIITHQCAFYTS